MITDCYDIETQPTSSLRDFYGEAGHVTDRCLIILSYRLFEHLLENFPCERIGAIKSCNGEREIYLLEYKGQRIAFYLSMIGSALAGGQCLEAAWITGATKFVMFGSCGSLDREKTAGKFLVPTESYRGEGLSYYYAPPRDYITIRNSERVKALFEQWGVPYVQGRVWTTDSFARETAGLVAKRKKEGCIAVEMELAGVQAVCDFEGYELYNFLEAGDVIEEGGYDVSGLHKANHDLAKLYIALDLAAMLA